MNAGLRAQDTWLYFWFMKRHFVSGFAFSAITRSRVEIKKSINKLSSCLSTQEISVLIDAKVIFQLHLELNERAENQQLCYETHTSPWQGTVGPTRFGSSYQSVKLLIQSLWLAEDGICALCHTTLGKNEFLFLRCEGLGRKMEIHSQSPQSQEI